MRVLVATLFIVAALTGSYAAAPNQCSIQVQLLADAIRELPETTLEKLGKKVEYTLNIAFEAYKTCRKQLPLCSYDLNQLLVEAKNVAVQAVSGKNPNIWDSLQPYLDKASESCIVDLTYFGQQIKTFLDGHELIATTKTASDPTNCVQTFNTAAAHLDSILNDIRTRPQDLIKLLQDFRVFSGDVNAWNHHCRIVYREIPRNQVRKSLEGDS
eukprot:TRINITY_DN3275_c0_g1_i1.p2 TRINITY_DN3275_c0_g1~~TRINITY_DN3275_c0_g1_i1.p2  ORF type:complete len:213 (-),score=96.26 TRINITY_DN3275_c0_g1_i1:250-888(-)